ncbi:hypothetical protein BGZ65_011254, partial [Modicella reniformis]
MVGLDSILGYVGFIATLVGWFPDNPDRGQVRVKFWAGRDGTNSGSELWGSAGYLPRIDIRSTSNEWIGEGGYLYNKIGNNEQKQEDVDMDKNQEINYITLTHQTTDAACLALIGWTPNDSIPNADRRKGFIIGDIFRLCGYAWNHSGQSVRVDDTKRYESVDCGWMVADRDGFVSQLSINLDVMGDHFIDDYKDKDLCYWGVGMRAGGFPARPRKGTNGMPPGPIKRSLPSPDEHSAEFGNQ